MEYFFRNFHWGKELPIKKYFQPQGIKEALDILSEFNGSAQVIAGGTDVIPQLRRGDIEVEALVDITRLPGLDYISTERDLIRIGGLVTHGQVCSSPIIKEKAWLLAEGSGAVGSPQIRNVATLAGNLVTGEPAADTAIPLLALNASVKIISIKNTREVPLTTFFLGKGKTSIDPHREILTEIRFPSLKKNQGGCYLRLSKRKSLSLPILVLACVVTTDPACKLLEDLCVALGPVAPIPFRASRTEGELRGKLISPHLLKLASEIASEESFPRSSVLRGSQEYRTEMIKVLIKRGLTRALEEAGVHLTMT